VSRQQRRFWVVILSGGDGRRLGSLTTNTDGVSAPKQYCSLNGGTSLLQLSLQRALRLVPRERIVLVVTEARRRCWEPNLFAQPRSSGVPSNRGTGLGILLPLPFDRTAENENMPTLGMSPNAPDSGFGHLSPAADSGVGMRPVQLIRAGLHPRHVPGLMSHLKTVVEYRPYSRVPPAALVALYGRRGWRRPFDRYAPRHVTARYRRCRRTHTVSQPPSTGLLIERRSHPRDRCRFPGASAGADKAAYERKRAKLAALGSLGQKRVGRVMSNTEGVAICGESDSPYRP
jgi:hypothetical protein